METENKEKKVEEVQTYEIKYGCKNCGFITKEDIQMGFSAMNTEYQHKCEYCGCNCNKMKIGGYKEISSNNNSIDSSEVAFAAGVGGFLGGGLG